MVRCLVAHPDPGVIAQISRQFARDFEIGTVTDPFAALRAAQHARPHVAIVGGVCAAANVVEFLRSEGAHVLQVPVQPLTFPDLADLWGRAMQAAAAPAAPRGRRLSVASVVTPRPVPAGAAAPAAIALQPSRATRPAFPPPVTARPVEPIDLPADSPVPSPAAARRAVPLAETMDLYSARTSVSAGHPNPFARPVRARRVADPCGFGTTLPGVAQRAPTPPPASAAVRAGRTTRSVALSAAVTRGVALKPRHRWPRARLAPIALAVALFAGLFAWRWVASRAGGETTAARASHGLP